MNTTEKQTHTPGPWTLETVKTSIGVCHKVGPFPSRGVHPITHACVYEDGMAYWRIIDSMDTELLANARLIAAAPDLLAACKTLVTGEEGYGDMAAAMEAARAAITRAEGK